MPLLGFGNVLWKGVREAVDANGFLGLFQGGFKACAVGVSAALIFGYLASVLFEPKMKKKVTHEIKRKRLLTVPG